MQQQKSLTHLPQSQNYQGIFHVLPVDAGKDLGFSLRGLLLVKTKKSSSGMKLLIFLRESGHAPLENFEILEV